MGGATATHRENEKTLNLTEKQTSFYQALFNADGTLRKTDIVEAAYFGGFGSGKSLIVALATMTIVQVYAGAPWLYARETYTELKDSVIPQFLEDFPPEKFGYRYIQHKREAHFKNGSLIYFRAFDNGDKIKSNSYAGASICQAEEVPYELYLQIWGRMRHKKSGIPKHLMLLEGNPSDSWCKQRFIDNPIPKGSYFIEATTFDNPYLPPDYVQNLLEKYPESWIRRYVYGEWGNFDEMVLSGFSEKVNVIEPFEISPHYKKAIGGDYGYVNPSAFVYGAIDYDDNIIIYDEFYEKQQSMGEIAEAAMRHGKTVTVYDFATKAPSKDGKSIWSELQELGVPLIESNKDKLRNISVTNTLLKTGKLYITKNCVNLIKEIRGYKWKKLKLGEMKNHSEEVVKKDDHAIDALLYLVAYIEDLKSTDPKKLPYNKTLEFHTKSKDPRKSLLSLA